MAKMLLKEALVQIDGTDLSDHSFSLDTPSEKEQVDVSGFSTAGTQEFLPGLRTDTITIGMLQDFAAGSVHAVLYNVYSTEKAFLVKIRPRKSLPVSATNPNLRGYGFLYTYNGLSGELNARAEIEVNISAAPGSSFVWSAT